MCPTFQATQVGLLVMEEGPLSGSLLVFGEVLFDCFPDGDRVVGGAPFNVAWGLRGLGLTPVFLSALGDDDDGRRIRAMMESWGLSTRGLCLSENYPTGTVEILLEGGDASYRIPEFSAWDEIQGVRCEEPELVYHGLLALRHTNNRRLLQSIVEQTSAKRFFDLNLRPPYTPESILEEWLEGVDWLKLNLEELESVSGVTCGRLSEAKPVLEKITRHYGIKNVFLTAGGDGVLAYGDCGHHMISPAPRPSAALVDTVGAGDAFSAAMLYQISGGRPVAESLEPAVRMASRVCALKGALSHSSEFYEL